LGEEDRFASDVSRIATTPAPPLKRRGESGPGRKVLLERAAAMRSNPTEPEHRLWLALRDRRLGGYKFRRQAIIGARIVDFFCPAKSLVIEIDGNTHDRDRDLRRDAQMKAQFGFDVLRFTNLEVMQNLDGVLTAVELKLSVQNDRWRAGSRPPSSSEEGVGGGGASTSGASAGTVADMLRQASSQLSAASDTPRLDAELLMAHALGVSRSDLLLRHLADPAPAGFAALVARRLRHEPVAYIVGGQPFFGLDLIVTPEVLIPRGDSEALVERALAARPDARRVLDCGTGSGALLLAVLAHLPAAQGVGIDRSLGALAVAAANAARHGLAARARMVLADWAAPDWADGLGGPFDLVLANPPYVESEAGLAPSVRRFEPAGALFAGPDGLDAYRALVPQLPGLLAADGAALVEIGADQADSVGAIAAAAGLAANLHRDLGGRPRVLELVGAG
jgi:release factor-specific protein-(glutamine-N5) methyltransferase